MTKKQLKDIQVTPIRVLKEVRFSFVENEILKENIAINMHYIIFLYSLEDQYELLKTVSYSVFKSIIILTASIIESLINYKLKALIKTKAIHETDIMGSEILYKMFKKKEYKVSSSETIMAGIKKVSKVKRLKDDTNFRDLNIAAKRCSLFNQKLFKTSEKIRGARNKVHLTALSSVDDRYTRSDIDELFREAKEIIDCIRDYKPT